MNSIRIYTTQYCGYCVRAKALLSKKNLAFEEIPVDNNIELRSEVMRMSGQRTVPQIWINEQHIGGCMELMQLEASGQLDQILASD
ncbi:glutaredoxin 3 [Agarilytica rhodophyticola]|uniref:glutaredoxin 3 n=1 Tax=Agarilytica rhodophyticola TaxID=1737490 RepID=UPI000B347D89|nr:glutaredoxin 3 [Agarilytica rhodophyticola]